MILLYPLLLAGAAVMVWRRRGTGAAGPRWFAAWFVAGALMAFSLLTGLSIGLFVLPFAAAALLWTARRAPAPRETLGLVAGAGVVAGILAPLIGTIVCAVAFVAYYALPRGDGEQLTSTR